MLRLSEVSHDERRHVVALLTLAREATQLRKQMIENG